MKIDVMPNDWFDAFSGSLWQHRGNTRRAIDLNGCDGWVASSTEVGRLILQDQALAIIRAYGHEVVEEAEPERFPRPTHAVVYKEFNTIVAVGSRDDCEKWSNNNSNYTIVPIGHWWEAGGR